MLTKHTLSNFNSIGTFDVNSHATVSMEKFEITYIYREIDNDCLIYAKYVDDIFLI